jgi:SAM-dependent methyltransferase
MISRRQKFRTKNGMGWTAAVPGQMSERFIAFAQECGRPTVDLGCAYGVAAIPAGAIAVDLEMSHLAALPTGMARVVGRFPELAFRAGSLGAVHASNVLHFLTGEELEEGVQRMGHWLAPGGKVFVQASTPYQRPFAGFVPEFARRVEAGERWPGWVAETRLITGYRRLHQYPASIHLLDEEVLRRLFRGWEIEYCGYYRRHGLPASLYLDGRESVGLIARRS